MEKAEYIACWGKHPVFDGIRTVGRPKMQTDVFEDIKRGTEESMFILCASFLCPAV